MPYVVGTWDTGEAHLLSNHALLSCVDATAGSGVLALLKVQNLPQTCCPLQPCITRLFVNAVAAR